MLGWARSALALWDFVVSSPRRTAFALALAVGCGGQSSRHGSGSGDSKSGGTGTELGGSAGTIGGLGGGTSSGGGSTTGGSGASGSSGGICVQRTFEITRPAHNFFFVLDRSEALAGVRWNRAFETLSVLFSDPSLSGTGVALGVFPDSAVPPTCNDVTCSSEACGVPLVALGTLSAQGTPQDAHEYALQLALEDLTPDGAAPPLTAALEGALEWARLQGEQVVGRSHVVLIASGEENACSGSAVDVAARTFDEVGSRTFVLGFEDADRTLLDQIALSGGTDRALALGNEPDLNAAALLERTRTINGGLIACDFELPMTEVTDQDVDSTTVNLTLYADGVPTPLRKVRGADECLDELGWYFDNESNPQRIVLCPGACSALASYEYDKLEILAACRYPPPV